MNNHQLRRKAERKEFRDKIKLHMKLNFIKLNSVCSQIGITRNEFYNLMNGYLCSIPSKGIIDFEDFKGKVSIVLCLHNTQCHI